MYLQVSQKSSSAYINERSPKLNCQSANSATLVPIATSGHDQINPRKKSLVVMTSFSGAIKLWENFQLQWGINGMTNSYKMKTLISISSCIELSLLTFQPFLHAQVWGIALLQKALNATICQKSGIWSAFFQTSQTYTSHGTLHGRQTCQYGHHQRGRRGPSKKDNWKSLWRLFHESRSRNFDIILI